MTASILEPGRNCWRRVRAGRVAFLIDAAAYFEALADAIERAERSILMVGWDFNSRVRLRRGAGADGNGEGEAQDDELAARLTAALERRDGLHAHVLEWDFAMIYALERETLPLLRFELGTHRRLHFRLDDRHPLGGSHHQKLVVIDDALAFAGGIDVTACRWDTSEHAARDPRRSDPGFGDYGPFHDVQMAVDGEAAAALGALARERWRRATGQKIREPDAESDPWPAALEPDLRGVEVAIARTDPALEGRAEVREVETLFLDAIRSARTCIYLENQYLTAQCIGEALAERLGEDDAPEVVAVVPRDCSGWLEENTMGVLRARLLRRLRAADRRGRLRVYSPSLPGLDEQHYTLHAKVMVVDDRLLRIGSANLANRSMGLDSECDLAVEAGGDARVASAVRGLRDRLLAEHLGVTPERVGREADASGSLIGAVEKLRGGSRSLEPVDGEVPEWLDRLVPESAVLDPERPIEYELLRRNLGPLEPEAGQAPRRLRVVAVLAALALLALAWRLGPLGDVATAENLAALAEPVRDSAAGPLLAVVVFVVGGFAMLPVTALIAASGLLYGWLPGFAISLAGALASAAAGYGAGRVLWRDQVRRIAGRRLNRLSGRLARRGVLSVAAVRLLPIAPFTVVNLAAGASHISFRDFVLGTLIGLGPGALILSLLADRTAAAIANPDAPSVAVVVALAVALLGGSLWLGRWLSRRRRDPKPDAD